MAWDHLKVAIAISSVIWLLSYVLSLLIESMDLTTINDMAGIVTIILGLALLIGWGWAKLGTKPSTPKRRAHGSGGHGHKRRAAL
jgi:hypothetical protein